jgi:hypothetical protein
MLTKPRADIEGAVDFVSAPYLPVVERTERTTSFSIPNSPLDEQPQNSTFLFQINPCQASIARDILNLNRTIEQALTHKLPLDPDYLDQEAIFIQHSLLVCNTTTIGPFDHAFRIAALIYVKSLIRPVATIVQTSRILAEKLQAQLILARAHPTPLMNWMFFMGLMVSTKGSDEQAWFRGGLFTCDWPEMKADLKQVLWIDQIHDEFGEALWLEQIKP